jgi:hypothetical protein
MSVEARSAGDPAGRGPTRFELRGRRLGHEVFDLVYRRAVAESVLS